MGRSGISASSSFDARGGGPALHQIADLGSQNSRLLHRRSAALDRGCVERDCAQIPDQVFSHSLDPKLPLSYEGGAALITAETSRDRVQMKRLCDRCGSVIVEERGIGQIR